MSNFQTALRNLNSAAHEAARAHARGHDTETVVHGHGPTRVSEILRNMAAMTDMLVDRLPYRPTPEDDTSPQPKREDR